MFQKIQEVAKAIAAITSAILTTGVAAFVPDDWKVWVGLIGAVDGAVITYFVPNKAPADTTTGD